MLSKALLVVVAFTLLQFLLAFALAHFAIVVIGAAGWWVWSTWSRKDQHAQ